MLEFQYPLRVEVGCNAEIWLRAHYDKNVSVPSTGRSGLQHQLCNQPNRICCVSVPSTGRSGLQHIRSFQYTVVTSGFQYPLRVEVGCNLTCYLVDAADSGFSTLYGSKWVATSTVLVGQRCCTSFSTLYGSKWVATYGDHDLCPVIHQFQYPLRVEVGCNAERALARSER